MKRPLLCIAVILLPVVANTQSALEHHIWQDKGLFKADSHTAQAITGAIKLSGSPNFARRGSMMTLTFGNGRVVKLKEVGAAWRVWDDVGRERVTGEVFSLDHDPGKLFGGNYLCGSHTKDSARFIVFYGEEKLGVDVFESNIAPTDIDSSGLCGTFTFSTPADSKVQ